jgi:hypothetical protein
MFVLDDVSQEDVPFAGCGSHCQGSMDIFLLDPEGGQVGQLPWKIGYFSVQLH